MLTYELLRLVRIYLCVLYYYMQKLQKELPVSNVFSALTKYFLQNRTVVKFSTCLYDDAYYFALMV